MASSGKKPKSNTPSGGTYSQRARTSGNNWEYVTPDGRVVTRSRKDRPGQRIPTKAAYDKPKPTTRKKPR